jgi:hypothetical protein
MAVRNAPYLGSAAGRRFALRVLAETMHLQTLDDVWTGEIEAMRSGETTWSPDAADDLGQLHQEMRDGLDSLEERVRDLREMLESASPDDVEEAASAIGRVSPVGADDAINELLLRNGLEDFDLRGALITGCQYVLDEAANERRILTDKWNRLQTGEIPESDFRLSFKCALYLTGVSAGVVATIATGGAPLLVGIAVAGQASLAAHGWSSSGCASTAQAISRGRRG